MRYKAFGRFLTIVLFLTVLLGGVYLGSTPITVCAEGGATDPIPKDSTGGDCVIGQPDPVGGGGLLATFLLVSQIAF